MTSSLTQSKSHTSIQTLPDTTAHQISTPTHSPSQTLLQLQWPPCHSWDTQATSHHKILSGDVSFENTFPQIVTGCNPSFRPRLRTHLHIHALYLPTPNVFCIAPPVIFAVCVFPICSFSLDYKLCEFRYLVCCVHSLLYL